MKHPLFSLLFCLILAPSLPAQEFSYPEVAGKKAGMTLLDATATRVVVEFTVPEFSMENVFVEGQQMKTILLPGAFLFNEEGTPNLPGKGSFIAIPKGARPKMRIVSATTASIGPVDIAPAPRIPLDIDPAPLEFKRNQEIYAKDELFPAAPAELSGIHEFRGIDVVTIGITPFQYNPVTKDLIVYKELTVEICFEGGNEQFGDPAFRNQWWDPILSDHLMNYSNLPDIDYTSRYPLKQGNPLNNECEYIIICPDGSAHQAWADSIRNFRTRQGILTKVFPVTSIGGNSVASIEAFIDNAYHTWTLKPVACLLLGDYGTDPGKDIISPLLTHYSGYPDFASDNQYADVTGDFLPDVVISRIAANDATQLQIMCTKFLNHERNPPVDPDFYDKPVTAMGWQTERWFQLCAEIVGGFFRESQYKHPRRINEIYEGTPGPIWSDAINTNTIVNYFGPAGLGYIPQQPTSMPCCWSGGTATRINQTIDSGAFVVMHRDHGSYTTWGEPSYSNYWAQQLNNTNLTYIFTINCQTGAFHRPSDCLGEKFHRQFKNGHNAGSLGFIAPTEVSYSFVNDTFVWGLMDNLWPGFMPSEYTSPLSRNIMPAFGNAAGKYFLQRSAWPAVSNSIKIMTHQMFHMHGDAFTTLYSEVPLPLQIAHDNTINYGTTAFQITATDSAFIALTYGDQILATGYGSSGGPVTLTIPVLPLGSQIRVTATRRNYFRYSAIVTVTTDELMANFVSSQSSFCKSGSVDFHDLSNGNPVAWSWSFPGGNPSVSTVQNPTGIIYSQLGDFDVKLTIYKSTGDSATITRQALVRIVEEPVANFSVLPGCPGILVGFTDLSLAGSGTITSWEWNFGDLDSGSDNTSVLQNPGHIYNKPGTYPVTLGVTASNQCKNTWVSDVQIHELPGVPQKPVGADSVNLNYVQQSIYAIPQIPTATQYTWSVEPAEAGTPTSHGETATITWDPGYRGTVDVMVKAANTCGESMASDQKKVVVYTPLGVNEMERTHLIIIPNPNRGVFTLDISTGINTMVNLLVVNTLGVVVYHEFDLPVPAKLRKPLNLTNLPDGGYMLKVEGEGIHRVANLLIAH